MSEKRIILPLRDAYKFGIEHGLAEAIEEIKSLEIEWESSYDSTVRRGYIIELFSKNKLFEEFKQKYWPFGNTPSGVTKTRSLLRVKERFEEFLQTGEQPAAIKGEDEIASESEEDRTFAAESDLRDFLVKNLDCIEKGLRLYDSDGRIGAEYTIDDGRGRIDLLALDANNGFVVVELKLEQGRNKTIGQLLYYMGWVDEHLAKKPCRGIIIAKEIPDDLILAVRRVTGVSLCRYHLSMSIEQVPLKKI